MKLIDLVMVVCKREPWPEGVKYITQDRDGSLWGFHGSKPYMSEERWWDCSDFLYTQLTKTHTDEVVDDFDTAIISWEDYKQVEQDYLPPKPMKIFEDDSASQFTQEFHDYFASKYGVHVAAIKEQLKRDMVKGVNALAVIEMVSSDLQIVRLLHNFDKED